MSMVDIDTFVLYPYFDRHLRSWTITAGDEPGQLSVSRNHSLWETLAEILDVAEITVLTTDEDVRAAEREQWDDGTNYLAVAPGVVSATSATCHQHHAAQTRIEVIGISGSELGRGRVAHVA